MSIEMENEDMCNEFAFETDHLALRGNKDYCELLKYIVKLESQKANALKDVEELAHAKNQALADPLKFLQELQSNTIQFPSRQVIEPLPSIDFEQYSINTSTIFGNFSEINSNKIYDKDTKVRGRKYSESKPETFNQLWSCEEQKRLEELLEIYPEEPIEARRFKKIAAALGTRTPIQVMSRIQKYFAKLAKAGLPIPGRAPKNRISSEKNRTQLFYKKSTFFPQLHVPVKMEEPCDDSSSIMESNYVTETALKKKLMLDLLKSAKEQRLLDGKCPVWQKNTMCVGCLKTGFLGARWTDNAGTDYCTDCFVKLLPNEKLIPVRESEN